jgi:NAD-dependent SIR2 family protein deacetylase
MKNNYDKALIRIITIMQRLYEGKSLKKSELALEFNVSEKTIQRDINSRLSKQPIKLVKGEGWKFDSSFLNANIAQKYSQVIQQGKQMEYLQSSIIKAKDMIEQADAVLITAGAGMGVDSGLPDFRGNDGFWRAYPPLKKIGLDFYDIANPKWFESDPRLAWGFYGHRLNLYRNTNPHYGFEILKIFTRLKNDNYFIFTSNVDGQFQKADFDADKIVEIHGSIHYNQCTDNCTDEVWSNKKINLKVDTATFLATSKLPICKHCGKLARPNILMFGDWGFSANRLRKQQQKFKSWLRDNVSKKIQIVIVELGAGKVVPTVRNFSEEIYSQYNTKFIRINPKDFDIPKDAISLPLGAQEALEKIYY